MKSTDWLFENGTKLYLLPLGITDKLYVDTPFESVKFIFNTKVTEYEIKHGRFKKKLVKKRSVKEQDELFHLRDAIGVVRPFLKSVEHFRASKCTLREAVAYLKQHGHIAGMTPVRRTEAREVNPRLTNLSVLVVNSDNGSPRNSATKNDAADDDEQSDEQEEDEEIKKEDQIVVGDEDD